MEVAAVHHRVLALLMEQVEMEDVVETVDITAKLVVPVVLVD